MGEGIFLSSSFIIFFLFLSFFLGERFNLLTSVRVISYRGSVIIQKVDEIFERRGTRKLNWIENRRWKRGKGSEKRMRS